MNEARAKIVRNLEGRIEGINYLAATSGVNGPNASRELVSMRAEGLIKVSRFGAGPRPSGPEMYRLSAGYYKAMANIA